MSTLRRHHDDAGRVVANARMIFSSSQRHTLVVEGETDYRLLKNWIADDCARIENVGNKDNVKKVWRAAKSRNVKCIHCVADLDYDLIAKVERINDSQFIYVSMESDKAAGEVECNDIESVMVRSNAFRKLMMQKSWRTDLYSSDFEAEINRVRESLRCASRDIGAFRAADMYYFNKYGRSPIGGDFYISDVFYNDELIKIDVDTLAQSLLKSSRLSLTAIEEVVDVARDLLKKYRDGWQLCRGHDLTDMLSRYLSIKLQRNIKQTDIERDLRTAYELGMLANTYFGKRLLAIGKAVGKEFLTA